MKNTEINSTLTIKENEEETVMKNTSRKEQEEKLLGIFVEHQAMHNDIISIISNDMIELAAYEIDDLCKNFCDEERRNIIVRGESQSRASLIKKEKEMIEEAISDGLIEHCEFVDSVISNIDNSIEALRAIWNEAGGHGEFESNCSDAEAMTEILRNRITELETLKNTDSEISSKHPEAPMTDDDYADSMMYDDNTDWMMCTYTPTEEDDTEYDSTEDEPVSKSGMCTVYEHDIADECSELMKQADCVVSSPPCNLTTLRRQYNEAGIKYTDDTYEPFVKNFFRHIDAIKPELLYIQVYPSNKNSLVKECEKRFEHVHIDMSYYYRRKKNLCWIIRCGKEDEAPGPEREIDAHAYIRWVCKNVECRCIADPCAGTMIVGINANRYEKKFVGTELNRQKIAALINAVTEYEKKKAEKEKKKMERRKRNR